MSIPDKQSGGVPPSSTPNAAPNTNPMPAMSPFAAHFQEQRERKKNMLMRHIDRISLSSKLVACTIAVLLIGVSVISFSIRALVNNYMLQKTDTQLSSQSQLVVNNIDLLSKNDSSGPNSYFLQIQYTDGTKDKEGNPLVVTPLMPQMQDGIVSVPILPTYGDTNGITLGQAFTTQAVAKQIITVQSDSADSQNDPANGNSNSSDTITKVLANPTANANHAAIVTARAPWRILPVTFQQNGKDRAVVYIGLSLADQIDTVNTLTRYCIVVGIAVVLLGGSLSTLIIQHTMTPLKRIEKTAAKIAAGDLTQRVPPASENTEVGSLSVSLNAMLTRIEQSFHEQEETTAKMKRFVSDASHELRTPLAAIHGYAELYKMQRDLPGALERADESISHIEDSSTRMTVLVEDLLSLARLDEGRGIDITQQVPLTTLVTDATEDLHALDPGREIRRGTLTFQPRNGDEPADLEFVEGPLPDVTLKGDGSRLRQVVTNIVGNIHRYTPADSPVEISVGVMPASISPESLARMSANDASMRYFIEAVDVSRSMQMGMNYAVVRFSDHGPGVPENSRSKIFERFYTADPSRARLKGGTGLGMAIAQSVVKAHKGFICATDSQGGGLTLTVVLPIAPLEPKIAVDEPPQDAKAERNKAKQEKRQARQHKSK